ncbi:hypothetical protein ACPOL_3637 [Acidisarcina polymorpha]|uniref:Uncharacterized protein n=1 Tax=Acidisarcina polymorpha TaxID=2211140 RepID=A0A2Z5G1L3_9BACT|nr:hypothetical protein ACPOL_3637 [Acidisarcina polymorpha]
MADRASRRMRKARHMRTLCCILKLNLMLRQESIHEASVNFS